MFYFKGFYVQYDVALCFSFWICQCFLDLSALSHVLWTTMLNVNVNAPSVKKDYFVHSFSPVSFYKNHCKLSQNHFSFTELPSPRAFSEGPINRKVRRCLCFCCCLLLLCGCWPYCSILSLYSLSMHLICSECDICIFFYYAHDQSAGSSAAGKVGQLHLTNSE